jgi:hypothetical protein
VSGKLMRVRRLVTALAFALLFAASWQSNAQTRPAYESAFLEYAQATKTFDTQKMSEFMHPEALKQFRAVFDAALNGPKSAEAAAALLPIFSASSAAEFEKLTDFQAYKRLNDTVVKSAPELVQMMLTSKYEIIDSSLKDGVASITYKIGVTVNGQPMNTHTVQTLRMHEGKWLLLLPLSAEGTISQIQAKFL